jgi:hypothetical protein
MVDSSSVRRSQFYHLAYLLWAIVVMAHLKAQETRKDNQARKYWKFELVRQLYERGYNRNEVFNLFKFIDWIIKLPKPLAREFWTELNTDEESRKMPYINSAMRKLALRGASRKIQRFSPRSCLKEG